MDFYYCYYYFCSPLFNSSWLWIVRSQFPGLNILFVVSLCWTKKILFRIPAMSFKSCTTLSCNSLYNECSGDISLEQYIMMMHLLFSDKSLQLYVNILLDQYTVYCNESLACCRRYHCANILQKWYISDILKGSNNIFLNCCNVLHVHYVRYIARTKCDIQQLLFALLFHNT